MFKVEPKALLVDDSCDSVVFVNLNTGYVFIRLWRKRRNGLGSNCNAYAWRHGGCHYARQL